jgi:hypothetical protein
MRAVDSARLFAERVLYYAERAPFLFRLQARIGAKEIVDDTALSLGQFPPVLSHEKTITNLMKEFQKTLLITRATLDDANATVKSVSGLMGQMSDNPETTGSAKETVGQLTALLKEWNRLMSPAPNQKGLFQMAGIADQVQRTSDRLVKRLAWLGIGLITAFWAMFVLSKLAYQYLRLKLFRDVKPMIQNEHKGKEAA